MNIKQLALTTCALSLSAQASAALVVDQESLFERSGSFLSSVVQSFLPSVDSISGVDVFLTTVATVNNSNISNVTATLYKANGPEDFNYLSNPVLASAIVSLDTTTNVNRFEGWAELRWNAVTITPESYYVIAFTRDNGAFSTGTDTYDRGQFLDTSNNGNRDNIDLNFKTYYDDNLVSAVPVPAAAWLFGSGLIGLVGIARRKNS